MVDVSPRGVPQIRDSLVYYPYKMMISLFCFICFIDIWSIFNTCIVTDRNFSCTVNAVNAMNIICMD